MTALDFLKSKGLIRDGFTELIMRGEFGQIELTKLLEEYKQEQLTSTDVSQRRERLCEVEKLCRMNQNFVCNCIDDSRCPNF